MRLPVAILVFLAGPCLDAGLARAQTPSDEHASHHPQPPAAAEPAPAPPAGGMGMDEHAKHHPEGGGGAGMGGMGDMMKQMHPLPPKPLYPTLMSLSDLTPERRAEIERRADEQMRAGTALLGEGLDRLTASASGDDFAAMEQATSRMRGGLGQLEAGVAAHRALSDGAAPREVALGWFRREMNLLEPAGERDGGTLWFHAFVMASLIGFAAAMIAMYFSKMRRAAALLRALAGGEVQGASAAAPQTAPPQTLRTAGDEPERATRRWSGRLRVARIFRETPNVKTFRLMNPLGGVLPFSYLPGQFLTVAAPGDGTPVRRSYTIASSPTQNDYAEITVKHEPGGVVSGYLDERVREGDLLDVSGPAGSFTFTGRECSCILLIGAGVGVTPLMSVLRYLIDRSWPGDIYFIYGAHSPGDVIFREELDYLARRNANLRVVVTVTHPEGTDWAGPTGRIGKDLLAASVPDLASRYVHICGPVPFMEAVKRDLVELGVPASRVKMEAFGPALGRPEPAVAPGNAASVAPDRNLPTVSFSLSGKAAPLPPDKVILDVADEIGVEIDNSCRVGTCGICRVKLLEGEVTMAVEEGLEPGDRENRIVLACQAKSAGNVKVEA